MVSAKSLGTEYDSAGIYIPVFTPGTSKEKSLYIKSESGGVPVAKTDVFAFYIKYEGKERIADGVDPVPYYSLYRQLTGYIRRIRFVPANPERNRQYPSFEILLQDDGDDEYYKIEMIADSAAANSICSSLLDPRADFTRPFIFTCYKKDDKARKKVYVNVPVTQSHLPKRENGYPDNLHLDIRQQLPTSLNVKLNKQLPDWFSSDWRSLADSYDSKYHDKPIFIGLVEYLNDKVLAVHGSVPSDEEILAQLRDTTETKSSMSAASIDYGDYEDEEEEIDTSFFSAFNATPVAAPQSTVVDELAPFFTKLDWGDTEKTAFYSKYGASNTPSLIVTGKLEAAKEYLRKMEEIYAISATLLPAMGATDKDRDAISKMATFVASKGVLGLNAIDATLQKAKDLKAALVDPFAGGEEEGGDIPF